MAQPTETQRHISQPLTNISIAYVQSPNNYIADKVFPRVPVGKNTNKYFIYTQAYWARSDVQKRAPHTEAPVAGYELSTDQYFTDVRSIAYDIDEMDRTNTDAPLNDDNDGAVFVTNQMLIQRDVDWAADFFTTSIWTGSSSGSDITPGTTWTGAAATPVEDVDKEKEALIENTSGVVTGENVVFVMGHKVFRDLKNHPDILDRIKYNAGPGNPAVANANTLAQVFGVSRVLVAKSVYNSAAEGATASYSMIHGKRNGLLVYVNPSPSLRQPSGGYTFTWTGLLGGNAGAPEIRRLFFEELGPQGTTRIEANMAYDHKLVSSVCGVYFSNAVDA